MDAAVGYFGRWSSEDRSRSPICELVSVCRAFFR